MGHVQPGESADGESKTLPVQCTEEEVGDRRSFCEDGKRGLLCKLHVKSRVLHVFVYAVV